MRRLLAVITAVAAALALSACGEEGEPADAASATPSPTSSAPAAPGDLNAPPSPADISALDGVAVQGDLGAAPTLSFDLPFAVSTAVARVDVPGAGAAIEEGQLLKLHYLFVDGTTGEQGGSTWEIGTPQSFQLGDSAMPDAMNAVLADQKVGVRFLLAIPGAQEQADAAAGASTIFAFEVVEALPGRATGTAVAPPAGLPEVTLAGDGEPSIAIPAGTAEPTSLVAQTLVEGTGPVVEPGQLVTMHYTGWLWDGTEFDSSWGATPFLTAIGTGQVIPGWDQGLVGKTVGSQVLLVIPADLGYGDAGTGAIPPGATLVFVVDILDAGTVG